MCLVPESTNSDAYILDTACPVILHSSSRPHQLPLCHYKHPNPCLQLCLLPRLALSRGFDGAENTSLNSASGRQWEMGLVSGRVRRKRGVGWRPAVLSVTDKDLILCIFPHRPPSTDLPHCTHQSCVPDTHTHSLTLYFHSSHPHSLHVFIGTVDRTLYPPPLSFHHSPLLLLSFFFLFPPLLSHLPLCFTIHFLLCLPFSSDNSSLLLSCSLLPLFFL